MLMLMLVLLLLLLIESNQPMSLLKLLTARSAYGKATARQVPRIKTDLFFVRRLHRFTQIFFGVVSVICANLRNLWMNQSVSHIRLAKAFDVAVQSGL
jgi:hypothetical protein